MNKLEISDRDLNKLHPRFKLKVDLLLKDVWDKIFVTEWYRSQERQDYLYSLWRTRKWKKVTWTTTSNHTEGLAVDVAFHWNELYPKNMYTWLEIADIAKSYWINWWFDLWGTDKVHFQDNWKEFKGHLFLKDSKFWGFIQKDLASSFSFNDYLDNRPATIADIKELITLYDQRKNW